jgi:hypothetical protein
MSFHVAKLETNFRTVAELGPGDSLGTGIAALFSGVEKYYALDVKPYFNNDTNLEILDQLLELFHRREPLPADDEFPGVWPKLTDYSFPHAILHAAKLEAALEPSRVTRIRKELGELANQWQGAHFGYFAPWNDNLVIQPNSVDLAFSQAVMEHVVDIDGTYAALTQWIRPGGYMSHTIDFRSHQTAAAWNGHWAYSDFTWKLIVGRRTFLINRQPYSRHIEAMGGHGFEVRMEQRAHEQGGLGRRRLAPRFREMGEVDLTTSGAYVMAQRQKQATADHNGR